MNLKLMIVLSTAFAITVGFSYTGHYFEDTYSEEYLLTSNKYSSIKDIGGSQNDCDFLNLCSSHINKIVSDVSSPYINKVVDMSYVDLYVNLPFP